MNPLYIQNIIADDMDGILLVDKETGITSYDVIRKIKRELGRKEKIGHAGTLDPFATGLLVILFGKATKLQDKIHEFDKGYFAQAKFGFETDTQDITGQKILFSEKIPDKGEIVEALPYFIGEIEQVPPNYSAVKLNGKKAYELAREGEKFELKSRKINVTKFNLEKTEDTKASFRIICSTGTYIRTLIVDLARKLGTYGTVAVLEREFIGPFKINEALSSSRITKESIESSIIPMDKLKELGI